MERRVCKVCGKYAGFSRNWTIGKILMYWFCGFMTGGIGFLFLPLIRKRCMNCGAEK